MLPFVTLEEAFTDCMRQRERLTFRTSLATQPAVCAKVTCLLAMLVGCKTAGVELTITEVRGNSGLLSKDQDCRMNFLKTSKPSLSLSLSPGTSGTVYRHVL